MTTPEEHPERSPGETLSGFGEPWHEGCRQGIVDTVLVAAGVALYVLAERGELDSLWTRLDPLLAAVPSGVLAWAVVVGLYVYVAVIACRYLLPRAKPTLGPSARS